MRPSHSPTYHRKLGLFLLAFGVLTLVGGIAAFQAFASAYTQASGWQKAQPCSASATENCAGETTADVSDQYTTNSKGCTPCYHVTLALANGVTQSTTLNDAQAYNQMAIGTQIPVTTWNGTIAVINLPGYGSISTDNNPNNVLTAGLFLLLIPGLAVYLIANGLLIMNSPKTPEDLFRDEVAGGAGAPPRPAPAGLFAAVAGWQAASAGLYSLIFGLLVLAVYAAQAGSHAGVVTSAPLALLATMVGVSFLVYLWRYRRARRDITTGVIMDIAVTRQSFLRSRNGVYGIRATYTLPGGMQAKVKVTAKWWHKVHIATKLHVLACPVSGKIWRLLGMTDDAGNAVY